jgi:salicylate hydroxylase
MTTAAKLHVVVVGAGLGGLACAIACRQHGLKVTVLERTDEIRPVGAGIQLPSNASKIMRRLGLSDQLTQHGAVLVQNHTLRSYMSGEILARKTAGPTMARDYGGAWMVIHRAAYQQLLLDEAIRLGTNLRTGCEVVRVEEMQNAVFLHTGEKVVGDVIIGADGLWSFLRSVVLGVQSLPSETGDLAYRGTFTAAQLQATGDMAIQELLEESDVQVWLGPDKHVVFYPLNGKDEYNLVLV